MIAAAVRSPTFVPVALGMIPRFIVAGRLKR